VRESNSYSHVVILSCCWIRFTHKLVICLFKYSFVDLCSESYMCFRY
ncbi:unnamed protein product, partial [Brassica napus]